MKIKLPKRTIEIWIKHERPDLEAFTFVEMDIREVHNANGMRQLVRRHMPHTKCEVHIDGKRYLGNAYCALGDQFRKRRGLAMATKRALAQTNLSREERTLVYGVLLGRVKQKV